MTYKELEQHYGHDIVIANYGEGVNLALECETCNQVLEDKNREDN